MRIGLTAPPGPNERDQDPSHAPTAERGDGGRRPFTGGSAASSPLFPSIDSCPGCRGELRCTTVVDAVAFRCRSCDGLWRFELGRAYRLRPARRLPGSDE